MSQRKPAVASETTLADVKQLGLWASLASLSYIEDWVDTSAFVTALFGADGTQVGLFRFLFGMSQDGKTIEGKVGPHLYHLLSSKDVFARQMLVQRGLAPEQVTEQALPIGEAFHRLVDFTGESPQALTQLLHSTHQVGLTWYVFAGVGVLSAVTIYVYGRWIATLAKREAETA